MSIFGKIKDAIFGKAQAQPAPQRQGGGGEDQVSAAAPLHPAEAAALPLDEFRGAVGAEDEEE